jgi:Astacin (Peptidase family M12A).
MRKWFCIDWPIPLERQAEARAAALAERGSNAPMEAPVPAGSQALSHVSMAILTERLWAPGSTVRVRFIDGEQWQRELVASVASEWAQQANIHFAFDSADPDAEVRISFVPNDGSWSRIGTDSRLDGSEQATMNLGWLDRNHTDEDLHGVILHEFGHALGCIHEHQSPAARIPWDKEAAYRYYAGPPNNWDQAKTDHNVLETYDRSQTRFTEFDPLSIMVYPIPEEHTVGDFHVDPTFALSPQDRAFIHAAYQSPTENLLAADGEVVEAEIGKPRQEDVFALQVERSGRYLLETSGPTNVRMAIYGPDAFDRLVANDDDSGRDGYNARISAVLMDGQYQVRVRHQAGGPGRYGVSATSQSQ